MSGRKFIIVAAATALPLTLVSGCSMCKARSVEVAAVPTQPARPAEPAPVTMTLVGTIL